MIQIQVDGGDLRTAGSHTSRHDTAAVCGRADTGFGLLFNYNLLAPGRHRLVAYADGAVFALEDFDTVSLGSEFLVGKQARYPLLNFPQLGQQAIVAWSEEMQNLGIVGVEPAPDVAGTYYGATIRCDCDPDNSIVSVRYGTYTVELADDRLTLTIAYTGGTGNTFEDKPATLGPDGTVTAGRRPLHRRERSGPHGRQPRHAVRQHHDPRGEVRTRLARSQRGAVRRLKSSRAAP